MAKNKNEKVEQTGSACDCKACGRPATIGWLFMLFAGLAHMLPNNMMPIMKLAVAGISLQTVIGVVCVVLALNFLLRD